MSDQKQCSFEVMQFSFSIMASLVLYFVYFQFRNYVSATIIRQNWSKIKGGFVFLTRV